MFVTCPQLRAGGSCHLVNFVTIDTVSLYFASILHCWHCQPVLFSHFGAVRLYLIYILVLSAYILKLHTHYSEVANAVQLVNTLLAADSLVIRGLFRELLNLPIWLLPSKCALPMKAALSAQSE